MDKVFQSVEVMSCSPPNVLKTQEKDITLPCAISSNNVPMEVQQ